jgi:type II secretory pathway pseudopilin PulG
MELLIVIAIIITLAALVLSTIGYVQKKGARSRAEAEIAAISAACESYKADNGTYPTTSNTVVLTALSPVDNNSLVSSYASASLDLYTALIGDATHDGSVSGTAKPYMQFKPQMLGRQKRSDPVGPSNKITSISGAPPTQARPQIKCSGSRTGDAVEASLCRRVFALTLSLTPTRKSAV